jgi:hypothetical protein
MMQRRLAHVRRLRDLFHARRLLVAQRDSLGREPDAVRLGAGRHEMRQLPASFADQEAVHDLAVDQGRQLADMARRLEQPAQAQQGIEQVVVGPGDMDAEGGIHAGRQRRGLVRVLQQQAGDHRGIDVGPDAQIGFPGRRLGHLPRHPDVMREHHVACAVMDDAGIAHEQLPGTLRQQAQAGLVQHLAQGGRPRDAHRLQRRHLRNVHAVMGALCAAGARAAAASRDGVNALA